jgi:hypothetical protein
MNVASFKARSAPQWLMVASIVIGPIVSVAVAIGFFLDPSWFMGYLLALSIVNLPITVIGWRNRTRPLLEITDEEVRYASRDWLPLRRIAIREIDTIEFFGERRAVIRLRSGGRLGVQLRYIEPSSRTRAIAALQRVTRVGSSQA